EGERAGRNICDFIIDDKGEKIIIELKAVRFLTNEDYFQIKRYLSCSRLELGIIFNFRQKYLEPKRILNSELYNK
ncbi:MAG: GxxExxY protein, partial [Patescibacteria group bacterium]